MSLSFFTFTWIDDKRLELKMKITSHENGNAPLIPEALADYKNDLAILELLLSGTYEKGYRAIMNKDIRTMADIAERR